MTTPPPEIDLTTIDRGSVTAPAGFGKTQVIASTIVHHPERRFLVLTHTNAGVRSLHDRIVRSGATRTARVETISGLALRLARAFPTAIGWTEDAGIDHEAALDAARYILQRHTVLRAFLDSYDQIVVDEYQDCSVVQHAIISHLAEHIPTVVLGDPLQAIFTFTDLISWTDVQAMFPKAGVLATPHRWSDSNPELGNWLKEIREPLVTGQRVPLPSRGAVEIRRLSREIYRGGLHGCINDAGSQAILVSDSARADEIASYAKTLRGRAAVHEAVEQPDLLAFADKVAAGPPPAQILLLAIEFARLTTLGVTGPSQVVTLRKNLATKGKPGTVVNSLNDTARRFIDRRDPITLAEFIDQLTTGDGRTTYRPGLLSTLRRALRSLGSEPLTGLPDVARAAVDARRRMSAPLTARCSTGSTLRMKGLEYDYVTLVDPDRVPTAQHLYVALSRARSRITLAIPPGSTLGRWFG